jgi:hypothetical protein
LERSSHFGFGLSAGLWVGDKLVYDAEASSDD